MNSQYLRQPIVWFERTLDGTTMYRVVSSALIGLVLTALVFGGLDVLPYGLAEQLVALGTVVGVGVSLNFLLGRILRAPVNQESALITVLIVYFLVVPPTVGNWIGLSALAAAVAAAILSKFVFAWRRQHIVNPAAAGAVAIALVYSLFPLPGYFEPTWWIGTPALFVPLLLAGAAVVYKVRKWVPVLSFLGVAFVVYMFESWRFGSELLAAAPAFWLSGPSLFLAFFMLTEPFTMPPTKRLQAGYGVMVGFLSQTTIFMPWFKMTPELALVLGNLVMYPTTVRQKLYLTLQSSRELASYTWEYVFSKPRSLNFQAGQYLEWMLPHQKSDSRGIRRYFTIASAPTEDVVRLGVKLPEADMSSYKHTLAALVPGDTIIASQRAGDFMLPTDPTLPVVMVAGGIGVTPFRSQLQYLYDTNDTRPVTLFYCCNQETELAYLDEFLRYAERLQLTVVPVIAKGATTAGYESGYLTNEIISQYVAAPANCRWYLSGPPGMVNAYSGLLQTAGVPQRQIVKDFFPGLA